MSNNRISRFDDLSSMSPAEFADFINMLQTARSVGSLTASAVEPLLDILIDTCLQLKKLAKEQASFFHSLNPDQRRVFPVTDSVYIKPNPTGLGPDKVIHEQINRPKGRKDPLVNELLGPGVAKYIYIPSSTKALADDRLAVFFDKIARVAVAVKSTGTLPQGIFLTRDEGSKASPKEKEAQSGSSKDPLTPKQRPTSKNNLMAIRRRNRAKKKHKS